MRFNRFSLRSVMAGPRRRAQALTPYERRPAKLQIWSRLRPGLRAQRGEHPEERGGQEALHQALVDGRAKPNVAALILSLEAFSDGTPLAECPELAALFTAGDPAAAALAADFTAATAAALDAAPTIWKVRMVNCVPGSPIDCAAITPTASPILTLCPRAKSRP